MLVSMVMKCLSLKSIVFCLTLICLANRSLAQFNTDTMSSARIFQLSLEELINIPVYSSSKLEQKQSEASNVVSVISNDILMRMGLQSVNDILSFQPGYFITQDYERRTVGFRGMFEGWNNNHILMLVDGIPFNDNLYGTAYTWDITPMNFLNSLEVIFGPGGALYGSNAMSGVVSLNTLKVSNINGVGRANLRFGSHGYQYYDIVTGVENDDFGVIASYAGMSTNGNEYFSYDASGRVDDYGNSLRFKTHDARVSSYFFTKFYGKRKYDGLMFQFHQQNWDFQTGHGWLFNIPDRPENMKEFRRIFALRYAPLRLGKKFKYEFTSRFQVHGIDWNMRYYSNGALDGYYPDGVSEYLNTQAKDLFVRAQVNYSENSNSIILGAESSTFFYNGDNSHYANIDMNTWSSPDDLTYHRLNPWLEFVVDKPVFNVAVYAQYLSPKFFNRLQVTLSGRYDRMFFDYNDLSIPSHPLKSKNFHMFTPRVALVYSVSEKLVLKAIYGKAFRTPSPTEMFGYNTYTLASNIDGLKPELLTNYDLGFMWEPLLGFNLRLNGFMMNFENQIAYSVANKNLSTNIYSLKTCGVEFAAQYAQKNFTGFTNFSYSRRFDEEILDSTVALSKSKVTWAPSLLIKLGAMYKFNRVCLSALGYYQNRAYRRESDQFDGMSNYRPADYVDGWFTMNARGAYRITRKSEFSISVRNVFNSERYIPKNNQYPFDYQMDGRTIIGEYVLRF